MEEQGAPREGAELALGERRAFFRLVRRVGYGVIAVFVLFMFILVWSDAHGTLGDAYNNVPMYIPLPQLTFVLVFGLLLFNVTGVVFGALEIHAASSGEQRYIIARHSYVTGIATTAFAAFFLLVLVAFVPYVDAQMDFKRELELGYGAPQGRISAPFNVSSDPTGSSYLNWVTVESSDGLFFTVTVYYHDDYDELNDTRNRGQELIVAENVSYFHFDLPAGEVTTTPLQSVSLRKQVSDPLESRAYFIVVDRKLTNSSHILYQQDRTVDQGFMGAITTLLAVVIVLNAGATVYNRVVREKWRAYGIRNY